MSKLNTLQGMVESADLKTADEVAEWLSGFGAAADVIDYTDDEGAQRVQIRLGRATCSLMLPLSPGDALWYYAWLVQGNAVPR